MEPPRVSWMELPRRLLPTHEWMAGVCYAIFFSESACFLFFIALMWIYLSASARQVARSAAVPCTEPPTTASLVVARRAFRTSSAGD